MPGTVYVGIHNVATNQQLPPEHEFLQSHLSFLILFVALAFLPENTAVRGMSSPYSLAFDASSGIMSNSTNPGHVQPRCFDSKFGNSTNGNLGNFDATDGGIPVTFGLNCLGWMVRKH